MLRNNTRTEAFMAHSNARLNFHGRCLLVERVIAQLGARHIFIRPHCPWQNGKVERFNRTLQVEWAYRQVFSSNRERSLALAPWLQRYNYERPHTSLGGRPPISRVS
jgi:transposase InsO family protein